MITKEQFYKGRDKAYAADLTDDIRKAADETLRRTNLLLTRFEASHATGSKQPRTATSGWRPPSVNAATKRAALKSLHMTGHAIDISDADGSLDKWLMTATGQKALEEIGLWMEHPSATPTWAHLQTKAPRSGRRVFYP